jgi:hypothetical protein
LWGSRSFCLCICLHAALHLWIYICWTIPCIPGIKPTWSWCMIYLARCWICLRVFCGNFASTFIKDIGL